MNAKVSVVGKHEFIRKDGKTAYVLELVDLDRECVYKAFTSKKHYDTIEKTKDYDGFISFENGFTKFYLPKDQVK